MYETLNSAYLRIHVLFFYMFPLISSTSSLPHFRTIRVERNVTGPGLRLDFPFDNLSWRFAIEYTSSTNNRQLYVDFALFFQPPSNSSHALLSFIKADAMLAGGGPVCSPGVLLSPSLCNDKGDDVWKI